MKAVFFDFDETLGDRERYAYACYRDLLKQSCDEQDPMAFEAILQDVMLWDQHGDVNKGYIRDMLKKVYGIAIRDDLHAYWDTVLWKYTEAFEESYDTLAYLSQKYILGLITNGPSDGQRRKLETAGLASFFVAEHITVSGDYPFKKPDPRLFLAACEKAGLAPSECWYVGDNFARDIYGAYRAGLKPIWMQKHSRLCSVDVPIIHKIADLKTLL